VLELLRQEAVVGIEKREVLPGCELDRRIAGRSGATVLLARETDALAVPLGDRPRVVLRAVVDDDDLDRAVGLGECAVDRLVEVEPGVVGRDQDADQVRGGRGVVSCVRARSRSSFAFSSSNDLAAARLPATRLPPW